MFSPVFGYFCIIMGMFLRHTGFEGFAWEFQGRHGSPFDLLDRFDRFRTSSRLRALRECMILPNDETTMPTVVGALEGKVKRVIEASAAESGRLIDPVSRVIMSRFVGLT